ncbi:SwmB domain-containing protein [Pseudomonas syringae]|uniref:SwmB domain-containing protein n=1 Tax=Pseudomonas syringae TaxID=317 RepID=UPI00067E3933|nr:SwmB domain-containing protein [Pseudomonas syringae]
MVIAVGPSVTSITRVNAATTNASALQYTVTFSASVTGVGTSDFSLTPTGTATGTVSYISGGGTTYTVGVSGVIGDGTLRLDLKSSATGIQDSSNNAITDGYTAGSAYTLDHTGPAVGSVSVPANATYAAGDNLDFTVNFNEATTVDTGGGTPRLAVTLDTGGTVYANYVSGSGTNALTFRYTVATGNADANGVSIGGSLNLNGGTLKDSVGNNATLTLNSVAALTGVLVSAPAPAPVAPVFGSAAVTGNSLVISYIEATTLDAVNKPANGTFEVKVGGVVDTVTAVTINAVTKTATLTLATAVTAGQTVTVAYTDPTVGNDLNALQNAAGTDAASFTAAAVTNNTVAPPVVVPVAPSTPSVGVTLTAPANGGTLQGSSLADTLVGSGSKDIFIPAGGADSVDGGSGIDTVVLSGTRAQYGITHQADGTFTVRSLTDANNVVTMKNVERLTFDNQTFVLDSTTASGRVAEFYKLALGRNPEENGLTLYVDASSQGLSTTQLALNFVNSLEFAKTTGALDNTAFVTQLYQNAFNRAPDATGLAFMMSQLTANPGTIGKASVVANFIDSSEMAIKLAGMVDQGVALFAG